MHLYILPFSRDHAAINVPQSLLAVHLCGVNHPAVTAWKSQIKKYIHQKYKDINAVNVCIDSYVCKFIPKKYLLSS